MRRKIIAAAWIAGATGPLLLATVFVFGCCVLPFHGLMHKLMPICQMAASIVRGDPPAGSQARSEALPPAPGNTKQEPVKRTVTEVPARLRLAAISAAHQLAAPNATTGYRSFITLGAIRCDRDVGLHLLGETFLI